MYKIYTIIFTIIFSNFLSAQTLIKEAEKIIEQGSIPEMAFAIITKDSVIIKKVIGHHKISEISNYPTSNIDDYFHLGSNTKAITGFVAAKLVEKNKIKWNTKFFDLFPELKNKSNPEYFNITLEDLLSHRANVQPFTSGNEYQNLPKIDGNKQEKRRQFAEYVLTLKPIKNEEKYNYSNAGYSIATLMLEKVSGKSWEKLVDKFLREKLNLNFAFGWPNRNFENQPFGHWIENGKLVSISPTIDYDLSMAEPAGDLSMNIENYAKFIQLNIQGLAGQSNFLKAKTYQYIHTNKYEYAIGWGNYTKNNEQISEHAGSDGTFFSYALIDRKNLIGYIVLVNSGSTTAQNGVYEMIKKMKINNTAGNY